MSALLQRSCRVAELGGLLYIMMLRFVFAALIVVLDQFFKHWIVRTIEVGATGPEIIPGILRLRHLENDGAMLNILSGQQWLLAGIAFVVSVALVMILLRYNEGFTGTLGLSAVLGGAIGNLYDRIFNDGSVIDMFETLFIPFPIFNIADIFITLGMGTFLVHFIVLSVRAEKEEKAASEPLFEGREHGGEEAYDEFPGIDAVVSEKAEQSLGGYEESEVAASAETAQDADDFSNIDDAVAANAEQNLPATADFEDSGAEFDTLTNIDVSNYDESDAGTVSNVSFSLDALEAELDLESISSADYDINDLLREYGSEDNKDS